MSDRFFVDGPLDLGDVALTGPEAHHLTAVRRFAVGDIVTLFNGDGREHRARVVEIGKKSVALQVTGVESPNRELGFSLHVASALPKGDRGDFLIEKLTELGVTDFTPLETQRGIVKASEAKADKLRRAVIEASKQCGRNFLMLVHSPARWLDWCRAQSGRRLIAHPGDPEAQARDSAGASLALRALPSFDASDRVTIAVGPEGGFSEQELQAARAAGWEMLALGPRILRVETAAVAAAAVLGLTRKP